MKTLHLKATKVVSTLIEPKLLLGPAVPLFVLVNSCSKVVLREQSLPDKGTLMKL
jgi:hypothetical protein